MKKNFYQTFMLELQNIKKSDNDVKLQSLFAKYPAIISEHFQIYKDELEEEDGYEVYGEIFHKSFRQISIFPNPEDDWTVWELLSDDNSVFWKILPLLFKD